MIRPGDVLLLGVALLAVLFFIGGVIDVFRRPANARRRRRRKVVGRRKLGRRGLKAEPLRAPELPAPETVTKLKSDAESASQPMAGVAATLTSRTSMVVATLVCVAVTLGILVIRSGGNVPVRPHPQPWGPSLTQRAEALAAQGNYKGAWSLYYQALQAAPEDVSLWYALGVTLSNLNQRKETEQAFQYVVRYGRPDSEEVRVARRWLVRAGSLVKPVAFTGATDSPPDARRDAAAVKGTVAWDAPDSDRPRIRIQLMLAGLNGAVEGKRFYTQATFGESYRFEHLPAGSYRLIGAARGQRLWDLTLSVEDGTEVVLDLGKDNSITSTLTLAR